MKYLEVKQSTDEWYKARLGKATASRFRDIIAVKSTPKVDANGDKYYPYTQKHEDYKRELVTERIVGMLGRKDVYVNDAMRWGTMNESAARMAYQLQTRNKVSQEGFAQLEIDGKLMPVGCSTDGLVNETGNLEIKSLQSENHLYKIAKAAEMPEDYKAQVQGQMWITGREWCDFVGHDSRIPPGLDLFATRVERDDDYIMYLESEVLKFVDEVERDFKYFLNFLPVCERACRDCGQVFVDKIHSCPDCVSANTVVRKVLQPAANSLPGLDTILEHKRLDSSSAL